MVFKYTGKCNLLTVIHNNKNNNLVNSEFNLISKKLI